MPPAPEEIERRVIRNRYGSETKDSLKSKIAKIKFEMNSIRGQNWINHILVNDNRDKFLGRAGVHIMHRMYELR